MLALLRSRDAALSRLFSFRCDSSYGIVSPMTIGPSDGDSSYGCEDSG